MASTFSNSDMVTVESNTTLSTLLETSSTVDLGQIVTREGIVPRRILQEVISTKPILVPRRRIDALQGNIELVAFDPLSGLIASQNKSFSPRLLNWVEPVEVSGIKKTAFYTEVNSGLKIGDRVFIIGGNYCNDALIVFRCFHLHIT